MTRVLQLSLREVYFNQIKAGTKLEEYRLIKPYWDVRLLGREYDLIRLRRGYTPLSEPSNFFDRPWRGCTIKTITHPHFGPDPVRVYAIKLPQE